MKFMASLNHALSRQTFVARAREAQIGRQGSSHQRFTAVHQPRVTENQPLSGSEVEQRARDDRDDIGDDRMNTGVRQHHRHGDIADEGDEAVHCVEAEQTRDGLPRP